NNNNNENETDATVTTEAPDEETDPVTEAPTTQGTTPADSDESGCASSFSGAAIALIGILGLGGAIFTKKRKS
ncbi:MAG: hypothetical protein J6B71_04165, partial [Clostridia bacterium]|nr:hypothetical protein [Clostridia bacterium]